jgi:hypothetical protein
LTCLARFHWALLIGPKKETGGAAGKRYHIKDQPIVPKWYYDVHDVRDVRVTAALLVRVTVAKIVDERRLINILDNIPVDPPDWEGKSEGTEPKWTCRTWVIAALKAIHADGGAVGTNALKDVEGPEGVIEVTKAFVARQIQEDRYGSGRDAMAPKPLLDMFTGKESYV